MFRRRGIRTILALCSACILFGTACALAAVELPAKLKEIPLFPNSKVEQAMDMEGTAMGSLRCKGTNVDAVAEFYKTAMKEKGWKMVFQAQQEDTQVVHFQKDSRLLHINVQADGDAVVCNMIMQAK